MILAIPLTGVVKSLADIILDPTLPPQTGAIFHNPLTRNNYKPALSPASGTEPDGKRESAKEAGV